MGDHGGGPTREMIRRGVRMAQSPVLPETRMTRMDSYFTGLKSKGIVGDPAAPVKNSSISNPDSGELPVWADELYLEKHRGAYTTHADAKDGNRRSERLMYSAELAASLAWLGEPGTKTADSSDESATTRPAILTNSPPGLFPITPAEQLHPALLGDVSAETSYPIQLFTKAWKDICLLQMHDILPGSGIHVNYEEAARLYRDLQSSVTESLAASLPRLLPATTHENTSGPVNYVFNLLPWERTGICLVPAEGMDTAELLDGKPLPAQKWPGDPTKLAVALTVPACGYQTIQLAKAPTTSTVIITTDTLENEFMRVRVDTRTGNLASVIEKSTGREMLGQYTTGSRVIKMPSQKYEATDESLLVSTTASLQGNILQAHGDYPMAYDAWEISMSGAVNELTTGVEVGAVTSGTLFADLPITRTLNKSTFKQTYRLYAGVPWLDVLSDMDWHERHTLLKAAFPLSLNNRSADYEIPFAAISRPAVRTKPEEIGKYEHCGIQWANYDDASGDAGFALLTNNKYGFDATDNVLRLTLLRGPDSPNQAADAGKPLTDEGRHVFSYGIFPHGGTWQQADVVRYGYEYNHSFISVQGPPPETTTTTGKSFLAVSPSNVMLASVKKAEDDDSVILRFYEAEGEPSTAAQITLPWKIEKVDNCDLLERTDTPVVQLQKAATVTSNTLQFQIGRHEIATYKLTLGE